MPILIPMKQKETCTNRSNYLFDDTEERRNPNLMNPSRKNRIAKGAGVDIAEVNRVVKQFEQMKKMMKQMPGLMGGKRGKRGMFKGFPF